jgi:FtsP/CotA-like multicopper oxidase with cupredoxin domain
LFSRQYVSRLCQLAAVRRLRALTFLVKAFVDVLMDFTDPVIRGMSLFHCHLLNHEDKGMMAKILFE